ncbi:MAG: 23S rRNA (pseudouridine(1915)-N(3))-methyltransferase RlmH [Clostridiales bacterium]|nr:23S rRNA (pseudouridine(1915)-N(3))-methyltransferase RlmH [Candidatus Equinaster intestinalis]
MIKIRILALGKLKEKYLREAVSEYEKRLSAFCSFEIIELEPVKLSDKPSPSEISAALGREADMLLSKIPQGALTVALCIEGKMLSSEELSKTVGEAAINGYSNIVFIIGSSYGLSDRIKNAANIKLSVSKMTFPHQLFRVMLCEQIYRAFKILQGGTYHK